MRVIISGASGLIGSALCSELRSGQHDVVTLVRRPAGAGEVQWDPANGVLPADALEGADAVVHLAGAGIGDHRWTAEYKREILDSRVRSTTLLAETIASCTQRPPVFLSGSAIGIYGASDDRELDEQSPVGSGFLADTCRQWEAAALPAAAAGTRVAYLRTGIVLTPKGGALKKMLPLFKLFAGGRFGNGKQWQSWISLPDEVGAICHLLTSDVEGPVNLTAPNPVTNAGFVKVLGKAMGRPSVLPVPSFGPKLLLGSELAEALLFTGQNVLPKVLQHSGYHFRHPRLDEAFAALLS
ncbi:MAG: TIGR01777 family oxidoreductase [Ilumatobacteraceae bacterium]|nr:TIGR01777 family oxidoreductase [Ilumatobacteraceae bacterium]MBP7888960.1 TIGR01777 family oxidoreductase [Ilumatobacteraceae bacterium]MBP8209680.1 TIGR01777 family oxidoreductase [Ilumatobacteraceae bacterium]